MYFLHYFVGIVQSRYESIWLISIYHTTPPCLSFNQQNRTNKCLQSIWKIMHIDYLFIRYRLPLVKKKIGNYCAFIQPIYLLKSSLFCSMIYHKYSIHQFHHLSQDNHSSMLKYYNSHQFSSLLFGRRETLP